MPMESRLIRLLDSSIIRLFDKSSGFASTVISGFSMTFTFDKINTLLGTYSFTPTTLINKIKLSKYDLTTSTYINYNCAGTVQVLLLPPLCFDGIYNFTAVNPNDPNDVIQVENGKFRIDYQPY